MALGLVVVGSSPAHAAVERCMDWGTNQNTFDLPGKPDVAVNTIVCIGNNGADYYAASVTVYWDGGPVWLNGDRFDLFETNVYRERNQVIQGPVYDCDDTLEINNETESWSPCLQNYEYYDTGGRWTGDGWIRYNINDDGEGTRYWYLHGSPSVP